MPQSSAQHQKWGKRGRRRQEQQRGITMMSKNSKIIIIFLRLLSTFKLANTKEGKSV
jgi:hypothetical protein